MGIIDRVPTRAVQWISRQQFRPLVGPVVTATTSWLRSRPRVVARGQAKGLRINPAGAAAGYALGTSEPLIQDVFAEHVQHGDVVWDIGANVGFYSLIAARLVGDGKVFAFEPLPANQAAIRENLALNQISNVEVICLALADTEGEAELEIHASPTWAKLDTSGDTAFKGDSRAAEHVRVAVSTIDRQLETLTVPDLVKMDIEGAEVAALRGASRLLAEHRPIVICELHGTNSAVADLLEAHDYLVRTIEAPEIPPRDAQWSVHVLALPR